MSLENQPNPDFPSNDAGRPDSPPLTDIPADGTPPRFPARNKDWDRVRDTRTGRAWTGLIVGAVVLVLLLVFIIQNLDSTRVYVLAWEFNLPLGVAILFAAIIGALLAALIGGARILQLRRAAKKPGR